ncbi:MAG: hypothetical protein JXO22_06895, partial [Phycisphaerae bacterium]|nr:hypothetical protein [Phycisphaerae bacterium]
MPTLYACVVLLGLLGLPGADGPGENTATTKPRDELATLLVATRLMDDVKCETSPHFEILRTGDADVAKLEARLEGVYAAHLNLMQELGITPHSGGRRIRVLYLANKHQFDEVRRQASAPVAAGGFYVRSANFAAFFDLRTEP